MSEWRPIETAPKDGRRILVYEPTPTDWLVKHGPEVRKYFEELTAKWNGQNWVQEPCECTEYDPDNRNPTHWQPLPNPPDTPSKHGYTATGAEK